jgi:hypothetical protein
LITSVLRASNASSITSSVLSKSGLKRSRWESSSSAMSRMPAELRRDAAIFHFGEYGDDAQWAWSKVRGGKGAKTSMRLRCLYVTATYCCAVLVGMATTGDAQAQDSPRDVAGWAKTRWGMSEMAVKAAVGKTSSSVDSDQPENNKDAYVPFVLPSLDIGRYSFRVRFVFDKKTRTLRNVSLSLNGNAGEGNLAAVSSLLQAKYGKPRPPKSIFDRGNWGFPSTLIDIIYLEPSQSSPEGIFMITYSSTKAQGSDAL